MALSVGFVVLLAFGFEQAAASVLVLLPIADAAMRARGAVHYVARHIGLAATGHLLVVLWGSAAATLVVASDSAVGSVRLAAAITAGAAVVAGVEWVVWAKYPRELGIHGAGTDRLPGTQALAGTMLFGATLVLQVLVGLVLMSGEGSPGPWLGATLGVYGIRAGLAVAGAVRRVVVGDSALRPIVGEAIRRFDPEMLIHFSGSIATLYQLEQWMPPIVSSGRRAVLVTREAPTFDAVADRWPVPTVLITDFPDLDLVVTPNVRVALYVNTGTKNNQLVRFDELTHVQLHHGDSDKAVSSSKVMRLYDHHVVAGQAAVDRLIAAGVLIGAGGASIVGRPQNSRLTLRRSGAPLTVLYAPTWEGYHLDTQLCSLAVMGPTLVKALPSDLSVLFRPHPLTGSVDRRLRRTLSEVRGLVEARGGRFVDPEKEQFVETVDHADMLIADISSVLVDFLSVDRPALVTDVQGLGAIEMRRRYPSVAWAGVLAPDLGNLDEVVDEARRDDRRGERHDARAYFLGDIDDPVRRFHEVLQGLVQGTSP